MVNTVFTKYSLAKWSLVYRLYCIKVRQKITLIIIEVLYMVPKNLVQKLEKLEIQ